MGNRRKWLAILVAVVAVISLFAISRRNREPSYDGRPLSYWLAHCSIHDEENEKARTAIGQIGTNAVPFLLRWMEYKPSAWTIYALNLRDSEFGRGWTWIPLWATGAKEMNRGDHAMIAFGALGPAGEPAIPDLTRLARSLDRDLSLRGCIALQHIGPPAIPALVQILEDAGVPADVRFTATRSLNELVYPAKVNGNLGNSAALAVLPLIRNLDDPDQWVAGEAASVLGTLGLKPEKCVAAFTNALQDTRPIVRDRVAAALGEFRGHALSAVPFLLRTINDDREARASAITAVIQIQPDALRRVQASLALALNDPDNTVQTAATNALLIIAPHVFNNAPPQ